MLKVWTRTVLFIQRVLHLHNCTCTCRTSHQSVPVFSLLWNGSYFANTNLLFIPVVLFDVLFFWVRMFFLSFEHVRKFASAWFFFKILQKKKKKNSLSLEVAAWLHVKRSPDVQVAAPARRHCEGCYVPCAAWKRSFQCHCAVPEAAWVVSFTCKKKFIL